MPVDSTMFYVLGVSDFETAGIIQAEQTKNIGTFFD